MKEYGDCFGPRQRSGARGRCAHQASQEVSSGTRGSTRAARLRPSAALLTSALCGRLSPDTGASRRLGLLVAEPWTKSQATLNPKYSDGTR